MRIVDLSMTVEECDSAPFAKDEYYFKLKPIVKWEDKGFVSNIVEMTVHAGTHIDSPHHFFRDMPNIEKLPLESMMGEAVVLDLTFKGTPNARITPDDMDRAEAALKAQGITIEPGEPAGLGDSEAERGQGAERVQRAERAAGDERARSKQDLGASRGHAATAAR